MIYLAGMIEGCVMNKRTNRESIDTMQRFRLFVNGVRELNDLRLVKSGMQWKFKIKWEAKSGLFEYVPPEIDKDDLRSFLVTFRKFISTSEHVFIHRIFNDCYRFLIDDKLKKEIRKAKNDWNKQFRSGPSMSLNIDGKSLMPVIKKSSAPSQHEVSYWQHGIWYD